MVDKNGHGGASPGQILVITPIEGIEEVNSTPVLALTPTPLLSQVRLTSSPAGPLL